MSDLHRATASPPAFNAGRPARPPDASHLLWCDLVSQIGAEVELLMRDATELVRRAAAGRHDPERWSALSRQIARARAVGAATRQIGRLAEGGHRTAPPGRLLLSGLLRQLLAERAAEFQGCGVQVAHLLPVTWVVAERPLVTSLAQSMLSWALEHAESEVTLLLQRDAAAARATLLCRLRHRATSRPCSRFGGPAAWGAHWQLVRQLAQALGWDLRSGDGGPDSWLALEFAVA